MVMNNHVTSNKKADKLKAKHSENKIKTEAKKFNNKNFAELLDILSCVTRK